MSTIHVSTLSYVERIIDIVQKRSIAADDFFAKVLIDYGAAVLAANQSQPAALPSLRTLTDAECEAIGIEFGPTRLAVNYTTLGRRMVNCVVAALQHSSSGITAGAEKSSQVFDSGAAGPTRTGDLLITNQGAETAETLGNQQDTPSTAPVEGAQAAQGESSTCEGVTAGLPAWNEPWAIERSAGGWVREIVDRNGAAVCYGSIHDVPAAMIRAAPELALALWKIAEYPRRRSDEVSAAVLRGIARAALDLIARPTRKGE